jgi:predicted CopG family antitoxin
MTSKTITIREEIYDLLMSIKKESESFSDLLERLAESQHSIRILEKIGGTFDLGDTESLIKDIRDKRG